MKVRHLGFYFRLFSILIILGFSLKASSQHLTIIQEGGKALEAAGVFNARTGDYWFSEKDGSVSISDVINSDTLVIEHLGYHIVKLSYNEIKEEGSIITLKQSSEILDEVLVTGRADRSDRELISQTAYISMKDISLHNPQTTVDIMSEKADVYVQKSQMGGGSPVLRGFEANRVLLVVDGVRMNNAIYRNGHLQNAISVDPNMLKDIEVIYGPSSLSYGSDALGGVIHFKSRTPYFETSSFRKNKIGVDYSLRYSSANNEKNAHLRWNKGWKNFAMISGFSFADFGELRAGSRRPKQYTDFGKREYYVSHELSGDELIQNEDPNIQIGTAYSQWDVFHKMAYRNGKHLRISSNFQYSSGTNVPRYDILTEESDSGLKYAEWYYGPQNRMLASLRMDLDRNGLIFDKAILVLASQRLDEDRYSRQFGNDILESTKEDVWVHSATLDFKKTWKERNKFIFGLDFQANYINSEGRGQNISTDQITQNVFSRYPDGYARMYNSGAYLNYIFDLDKIQIHSGVRVTSNRIQIAYDPYTFFQWPDHFYTGIENNTLAFAWSAGLKYLPFENGNLHANYSTAFRTPNIDDLAKTRVKNGEILIPNPELLPENAQSIDLGFRQKLFVEDREVNLGANLFATSLINGIVRSDFTLPAGESKYFDGTDSLKVVANVNADRVNIFGGTLSMEAKLISHISIGAQLSYTKGDIIEEDEKRPAEHIPPLYGAAWIEYKKGKWLVKGSCRFNGAKDISLYGGSVDNPEYATVDGSYAWTIYSVKMAYELREDMSINFGVENILDKHYRSFASGLSSPGINFIFNVRGQF